MIRLGRFARDLLEASIVALLLGLLVRTFVVQVYRVPSASMEPLLRSGDYLVVNKLLVRQSRGWSNPWLPQREVAQGDVLVFPHPRRAGRLLVKRCLAGSGDRVHVQDKRVYVDRERLMEPYAVFRDQRVFPASSFLPENYRVRDQFGPMVVSDGSLFCLGDNRDHSLDSRHWGSIDQRRVLGQAVYAARPPSTPAKSRSASAATAEAENAVADLAPATSGEHGWKIVRVR